MTESELIMLARKHADEVTDPYGRVVYEFDGYGLAAFVEAVSVGNAVAQVQVAEDYHPHLVWLDGVDPLKLDQKFLYIVPRQRKWQGLTYKERCELWNIASKFSPDSVIMHDFAKDIEQALKEKNYDKP